MLVGINQYFKIAIAYYLIDTLSNKEKSYILNDILHVAYNYKISICDITFDGASSNIMMIKQLGAKISNLGNLKTYIEHPVTKEPNNGHVRCMLHAKISQKYIIC